jgi:hypothetical protein
VKTAVGCIVVGIRGNYIDEWIGVVTFTVCFSLQEKYKEKVVKRHDEGFNWPNKPIDDRAIYANGGEKAHGW